MDNIKTIKQVPSPGYDWLYEDRGEDDRYFTTLVFRPEGTAPWAECTNEEKEEWEREHQQPEPPEPEQEGGEV